MVFVLVLSMTVNGEWPCGQGSLPFTCPLYGGESLPSQPPVAWMCLVRQLSRYRHSQKVGNWIWKDVVHSYENTWNTERSIWRDLIVHWILMENMIFFEYTGCIGMSFSCLQQTERVGSLVLYVRWSPLLGICFSSIVLSSGWSSLCVPNISVTRSVTMYNNFEISLIRDVVWLG